MTPDDIANIEAQLNVVLPKPYVEAALAGRFTDPIHEDAQAIIAINGAFREGEFGDEDWRGSLVAIGHDGGGNYFCLDTDASDSAFYLRDHETLDVAQAYENFDAFLAAWA